MQLANLIFEFGFSSFICSLPLQQQQMKNMNRFFADIILIARHCDESINNISLARARESRHGMACK